MPVLIARCPYAVSDVTTKSVPWPSHLSLTGL